MICLIREPLDYHALTEQVRLAHCGAVVTFLGTVRDLTGERVTVALDYEAYPGMAEKKMAEIEADTRARWPAGASAPVPRRGGGGGGAGGRPARGRRLRRLPSRHRSPQGVGADLEARALGRRHDR